MPKKLTTKEEVLSHIGSRGFDFKDFEIIFNAKGIRNVEAWVQSEDNKAFSIFSPKGYFREKVLDHELGHAEFTKRFPKINKALRYASLPFKIFYIPFGAVGNVLYFGGAYAVGVVNPDYALPFLAPIASYIAGEGIADVYGYGLRRKAKKIQCNRQNGAENYG